jgi:hypothetical protein
VTQTFNCLQEESLVQFPEKTKSPNICEEIKDQSFKAHPDCYTQAGFCELNIIDKFKIFMTIKAEIISKETVTQGIDLLRNCLFDKNTGGENLNN